MTDPGSPSLFFRLILRSLGAGHPMRLAVGVAAGVIAKIAVDVLAATYPDIAGLKAVQAYQMAWFVVVCAPLTFLPLILGKRSAPEAAVHTINTIQALLDRAGLSRPAERMVWLGLLKKYVDVVKPDMSDAPPNIEEIWKEEAKEMPIPKDAASS